MRFKYTPYRYLFAIHLDITKIPVICLRNNGYDVSIEKRLLFDANILSVAESLVKS